MCHARRLYPYGIRTQIPGGRDQTLNNAISHRYNRVVPVQNISPHIDYQDIAAKTLQASPMVPMYFLNSPELRYSTIEQYRTMTHYHISCGGSPLPSQRSESGPPVLNRAWYPSRA